MPKAAHTFPARHCWIIHNVYI